ncbi:MAG: hypothetical protein ACI4JE_04595 [Ruminococcus sp.]|nr:hypothetical protein [Oscillospiraceae bacterium]
MKNETSLFIDTNYQGFFQNCVIEEYMAEYEEKAEKLAEKIDWDEAVLYAILLYDSETQACISADFMLYRLDYSRYVKLCGKIAPNCRLFIKRSC